MLGFYFNGRYYYDKTLPMGLSYSCNLFEKFSSALHWIAVHKLGIHDCIHILDDFLFVASAPMDICMSNLSTFFNFFKTLGIKMKDETTCFPITRIS